MRGGGRTDPFSAARCRRGKRLRPASDDTPHRTGSAGSRRPAPASRRSSSRSCKPYGPRRACTIRVMITTAAMPATSEDRLAPARHLLDHVRGLRLSELTQALRPCERAEEAEHQAEWTTSHPSRARTGRLVDLSKEHEVIRSGLSAPRSRGPLLRRAGTHIRATPPTQTLFCRVPCLHRTRAPWTARPGVTLLRRPPGRSGGPRLRAGGSSRDRP